MTHSLSISLFVRNNLSFIYIFGDNVCHSFCSICDRHDVISSGVFNSWYGHCLATFQCCCQIAIDLPSTLDIDLTEKEYVLRIYIEYIWCCNEPNTSQPYIIIIIVRKLYPSSWQLFKDGFDIVYGISLDYM